jgi:hypothetical protein
MATLNLATKRTIDRLPKKQPSRRPTSDTPLVKKNRGQSKKHSMLESVTNVAVGFLLAVATQILVFPFFGVYLQPIENFAIAAVFTVISVLRSYYMRRFFNYLHTNEIL